MKKSIFLFRVFPIIMLFICTTGCKKEPEYNPKKKIESIYYAYQSTGEDNLPKTLKEKWIWDNNTLSRIEHWKEGRIDYTQNFIYDNKLLSQITMDEITCKFRYGKSELEEMEIFENNQLITKFIVTERSNKKISKLVIKDIMADPSKSGHDFTAKLSSAIRFLIPDRNENQLQEQLGHIFSQSTAKSELRSYTVEFIYQKNNIVEEKWYHENGVDRFTYTYDNKNNPYYNAYLDMVDGYREDINTTFSKNNVLTCIKPGNNRINYTYEYNGKWPVKKTCFIPMSSYQGPSWTNREIYYYEYQ